MEGNELDEDTTPTPMPSFDRVRENFFKRVENEMKINYPNTSSTLSASSNLFLSVRKIKLYS